MSPSDVSKTAETVDVGDLVWVHYTLDDSWPNGHASQICRYRGRVKSIEVNFRTFWIHFDDRTLIRQDDKWSFSSFDYKNTVTSLLVRKGGVS